MRRRRVLHLLSQRPALTGSGVTLEALVSQAARAGWEQRVVVGVPADDPHPRIGGVDPASVRPLFFGAGALDFPVPGMSDVMPYPSTRFSAMDASQLAAYREAWRAHVGRVVAEFRPDVIHSHHVWILSALVKAIAPDVSVVTQCHATGFRQMELCPHLAGEVRTGCARSDRFAVLHEGHAHTLASVLGVAPERIRVVGAGYRDDLFHARGRAARRGAGRILYVGKYAASKGLPALLDAVAGMAARRPGLELHVAGSGAGEEAEALRARMRGLAHLVRLHGQLDQPALADLMRTCDVFVLPSFYEGVPLVVVEALACGCRAVVTDLPGVRDEIAPHAGDALERVPLPRLAGVDTPRADDLPGFVAALTDALGRALDRPPLEGAGASLERFTWGAVFRRVEAIWMELAGSGSDSHITVISEARAQARDLGHNFVGTEHILLALLGPAGGAVGELLADLGVSPANVLREIRRLVPPGSASCGSAPLPFTPRVKRALDASLEEMKRSGSRSIETTHLLLGMLRVEDSVASRVLRKLGVTLEAVRDAIRG